MPSAIHNENALQTSQDIARALLTGFGHLKIPFSYATADAAVLFTVPSGMKLEIGRVFWETTVTFAGGATPKIGLKSSNAGYNTAGDLLGGGTGDGTLASTTQYSGTIGAKISTAASAAAPVILVAGDTIIFNRMTSAFTSGSGFVHVSFRVLD